MDQTDNLPADYNPACHCFSSSWGAPVNLPGGLPDGLYEEILQLSEAPGDFWILQMEDDGYTVRQFVYRENEYTVWYDADADAKYLVYHEDNIIHTGD